MEARICVLFLGLLIGRKEIKANKEVGDDGGQDDE